LGQTNAYVALSHHRTSAHMFVAGDFNDQDKLVKSLKWDDPKETSLALELADKAGPGPAFEQKAATNTAHKVNPAHVVNAKSVNDVWT